jgi:hypothetical protein
MKASTQFIVASLFAAGIFLTSCDPQVVCTEEFRTFTLEVVGDTLTQTYTIRKDNQDTVQSATEPFSENKYTVLSDAYQPEMENKTLDFIFHGYIGDSLVIDEDYNISADKCHIDGVTGKIKIEL